MPLEIGPDFGPVCSVDAEDVRIMIEHYQFQVMCWIHRPDSVQLGFAKDRLEYWTEVMQRTFL